MARAKKLLADSNNKQSYRNVYEGNDHGRNYLSFDDDFHEEQDDYDMMDDF